MADADDPRLAEAIADDAAVAAGRDQRVLDAASLQDRDAAIDGMTLADAAEIDAHAGLREAHGVLRLIEHDVPIVDAGQRGLDLLLVRAHVLPEVIQVADARIRDVERAVGDARIVERRVQQVEQLRRDLHRRLRRARVDDRQLAGRLVGAHRFVDPPHLGEHRFDRGACPAPRRRPTARRRCACP